jgi:hypothetical protein
MSPLATVRRSLGPPEDAALLPHMWLRKQWLTHALRNYPVYDPPHKVEERLLPKEQALENFDYFMRVRQERVAYFQKWLRRYFCTRIRADDKGVRALNRWARRYAGLLYPGGWNQVRSYYSYDPPWTGAGAGCNVVFDIGIALGEFIIANCPKLHWDMDPISAMMPKIAKARKANFGSGFWRPQLTGFKNPNWSKAPLSSSDVFASQMMRITTFWGLFHTPRMWRLSQLDILRELYRTTLKEYAAGDPATLYGSVGMPADLTEEDYGRCE